MKTLRKCVFFIGSSRTSLNLKEREIFSSSNDIFKKLQSTDLSVNAPKVAVELKSKPATMLAIAVSSKDLGKDFFYLNDHLLF